MADPCTPCTCVPYENICCCSQSGITVSQPLCQRLPDGSVVNNPCYDSIDKISYWTYKIITDCTQQTRGVSSIAIPVCETLHGNLLSVEEKIDGCGTFTPIDFELNKNDPVFGTAPQGFVFLKITTDDRYDKGVCAVYRLSISGNFPVGIKPISIKAGTSILDFNCDPENCYLVPRCPDIGRLLVVKDCTKVIENGEVFLEYSVLVNNIGNITLNNILYNDRVTYDSTNITIGTITVEPPTLNVDTSTPSLIIISGNLGSLSPGDAIPITYRIPITSILSPGTYLISNTATVESEEGVEASDSCSLEIEAVRLMGEKCCTSTGLDTFDFRIRVINVGNSPETQVTIEDTLIVPVGVTIQFTSFDGCTALFSDDLTPVPVNTDVTNRTIIITCENLTVPLGGSVTKNISIRIVSTTAFTMAVEILNILTDVVFLNMDQQILLGIDNVPTTASIQISGRAECLNPC